MEELIKKIIQEFRQAAEGKEMKPIKEKIGKETTIYYNYTILFALLWTSTAYSSILRLAGMKLGKRVGEESRKTELSLILEEIERVIIALRGGKIDLKISPELKKAELKIFNSPFLKDLPDTSQKICFFEEGLIGGYIEGAIQKNGPLALSGEELSIQRVSVEEKKCISLGDDHCEFLIEF